MDSVRGDRFGLDLPAQTQALLDAGPAFLTAAFRACGLDAQVARIVQSQEFASGSTGRKLVLNVEYAHASDLPTELFVKFSRDFDDPIRDRARDQLDAEVRLALLSRAREFPVAVPRCLFADYHAASGTGLLVTERIAYGQGGIERHYDKCLDDEMPEAFAHYTALVRALARLAGAHKSGRLGDVAREFPFDPLLAAATDPIRYDAAQLQRRVAKYAEFAARYPQLLPERICSTEFIDQLAVDIPRFLAQERAIKRELHADLDFIALCHWNANVDNAWFWRSTRGELECALMDWGRVGQMNVAQALLGSLIAAERELWDHHLDDLLGIFVAQLRDSGGPTLAVPALERQLFLFVAMMGLAWLMDAPALILRAVPDLDGVTGRRDPRFTANETARVQLHMLTTVLHLWESRRFGALLGEMS